jgi:hypothetical protein
MFAERQWQQWWAARSDEQRATLKQAAESSRLEPDTVKLLAGCPYGPIGTAWDEQADWDWSWPADVREFIASQ